MACCIFICAQRFYSSMIFRRFMCLCSAQYALPTWWSSQIIDFDLTLTLELGQELTENSVNKFSVSSNSQFNPRFGEKIQSANGIFVHK